MGTWGIEPFANDAANDWAYDLEEKTDLSLLEEALDDVIAEEGGYLESDLAVCGIAACEVLTCLLGRGSAPDAYTQKVHDWVARVELKPDASVLAKAHRAIDRILGEDSELRELWEEDGDMSWRESVQDLKRRLAPSAS